MVKLMLNYMRENNPDYCIFKDCDYPNCNCKPTSREDTEIHFEDWVTNLPIPEKEKTK